MSSHEELRVIALSEFAKSGYVGTSLQRIADVAGLSKSSVLYHFASKEALLGAAIEPALDRVERMVTDLEASPLTQESRDRFIGEFVDLLLEHRREVHMFINQAPSLIDVPAIDTANGLVTRLAAFFHTATSSTEEQMRFGIALGGAAYMLVSQENLQLEGPSNHAEIRGGLVTILTELLAPIPVHTTVA
jgi:AcrR family transcriptional regulator